MSGLGVTTPGRHHSYGRFRMETPICPRCEKPHWRFKPCERSKMPALQSVMDDEHKPWNQSEDTYRPVQWWESNDAA